MATVAPDPDALMAALDFLVAAGVDVALDDAPHDRFAESAGPVPPPVRAEPVRDKPAPPSPPPLARAATAPTGEITADARARARDAATLPELAAILASFEGCALRGSARQLVFADGVPGSPVMVLGEAPGAEEDRTGRPFVGRAGQLLDRMLAAIGLGRDGVYIANIVPWRPPGNRTPTPQEVAICLPFTLRQIELAAPTVLVTLGAPATQALLGMKDGIFRTRGRWFEHRVGSRDIAVLPMLHPAYLLRQPLHKRLAWRDLLLLRRRLDGAASSEP